MFKTQGRLRVGLPPEAMGKPSAAGESQCRAGPRRRSRRSNAQAFTLVELMIVVAILAILVAVAFPRYQQVRSAALIGTKIGELIGFAKACAVLNASGAGETPTPPAITAEQGGVQILEGCTGVNQGATLQASWGVARASGVACLNSKSSINSGKATVTLTAESALSCIFED